MKKTEANATKSLEVSMSGLSPIIEEIISSGGSVELTVTGNSMRPLLKHKVSTVRLAKAPEVLYRGDVPLYRRDNGAYVLHRIIRKKSTDGHTEYMMCGDNQWVLEPSIRQDQLIAVMTAFSRDGKKWTDCKNAGYRIYTQMWMAVRLIKRLVNGKLVS